MVSKSACRVVWTAVVVAAALAVAPAAMAQATYGWEDGGTILGSYGNLANPANVATGSDSIGPTTVIPHGGSTMLQVTEEPHAGTPQAYIAFVENLADGDIVTASFWGWDQTPSASPSLRVWGHWAQSGDVDSYEGSAGGNNTYTDGAGWGQVGWSWTLDTTANPTADALVIEARLYSTPSSGDYSTDYWIDDLTVEAPITATVSFPEPIPVELMSLTAE